LPTLGPAELVITGQHNALPEPITVGGSAGIAAQLRRSIVAGTYGFNDRLPSERHLAEHFGASRGTVREALRRLQEINMVDRQVGSGTFVTYREMSDHLQIAEMTSPLELIDVRIAIEPQMAELAVANATLVDIEKMRRALEKAEQTTHDPEAFTLADSEFHLALAECTRNRLMVWLYQLVNETRGHSQWNTMKGKILTPERIAEYNVQHRELFLSISSRNLNRAVDCITRHLERARSDLVGAKKIR